MKRHITGAGRPLSCSDNLDFVENTAGFPVVWVQGSVLPTITSAPGGDMFKRTLIAAAAMLAMAACAESPTTPVGNVSSFDALSGGGGGGADRVMVCHLDADFANPDEDGPGWELLEVKNNRALEQHLAHGDGLPGGDVPGMAGYAFDDACVPTATEPKVFAVAYVDRDANDGGYQEGTDDLIAMLVDANRDGVISVGDEIVRGGYPLDFDATALGEFGGSSSPVEFVWDLSSSDVLVGTGGTNAVWFNKGPTREFYFEETADEITDLHLRDDLTHALVESIQAVFDGGLSRPQTEVNLFRESLATDDAFLDVEIDLDGF